MQRGDAQHVFSQPVDTSDQESDYFQKNNTNVNKRTKKVKAKDSDDDEPMGSEDEQRKKNEGDSTESIAISKIETQGVFNRKKKRSVAFYDNKSGEMAPMKLASDKPENNNELSTQKKEEKAPFNSSLTEADHKPITTLVEDKNQWFETFDQLWAEELKKSKNIENSVLPNNSNETTDPLKNKEMVILPENPNSNSVIDTPELKVATIDAVQDSEIQVEILGEVPTAKAQDLAQANVSYTTEESNFMTATVYDNFDAVIEPVFPMAASTNIEYFNSTKEWIGSSDSETLPIFVQPRKNPWNVWPPLFTESLGVPSKDPLTNLVDEHSTKPLEDKWLEESKPQSDLARLLFENDTKEKKIANFFAEEARVLNERDIADYSINIEISKIEIYEEDVKRYHQSLKNRRGPVEHDIIFTTVETALHFIEKLVREREKKKKKVGFLPELFEKCLKSQATREKEKEEEKKKKEKAENKNKGPSKPKMWLVFNRTSKEKVIICTPGEFYDSD